jgi:OmpA-OmpF porin, OOP family
MPRGVRKALALGCAAVLVSLGCSGCFTLTTKPKSPSCAAAAPATGGSPGNTAGAASNTVVLIDTSASYWPRTGGSTRLTDERQEILNKLLSAYGKAGTQLVSLGTFNGSSTTITWLLNDAPLPTPYGTAKTIGRFEDAARSCLVRVIVQAEQTAPATGGTDVMAALDAAGQKIGSTSPGHSQVMLLTDGLSNAGCLNFNQVFSAGESASEVVRTCPGQGGLARLREVSLELAGIGLQAQAKPLSSSEQSLLVSYWRDLCTALGVAAAPSCVTSQGSGTSTRTSTVARPPDPPVSFPKVTGKVVPVPADLLFAFNSANLTQTAQSYLDILIPQIRASGLSVTEIVGHTDRVGTAAYNLGLSLRRAQAVRAYLAGQGGFTGIRTQGVGFSQPACRDEHTPAGRSNPACMARDRRVVIFLGGHT